MSVKINEGSRFLPLFGTVKFNLYISYIENRLFFINAMLSITIQLWSSWNAIIGIHHWTMNTNVREIYMYHIIHWKKYVLNSHFFSNNIQMKTFSLKHWVSGWWCLFFRIAFYNSLQVKGQNLAKIWPKSYFYLETPFKRHVF